MLKQIALALICLCLCTTVAIAEPPHDNLNETVGADTETDNSSATTNTTNTTLTTDVSDAEEPDMVFQFLVTAGIVIPLVMLVSYVVHEYYERQERRRRLQRFRDGMSRRIPLDELDSLAEAFEAMRSSSMSSVRTTPTTRSTGPKISTTTFKLRKRPKELREFSPGDGLFEIGIKKFQVLPYEKQVEFINQLPEVKEFNPSSREVMLDLGKYGKYLVEIKLKPKAYRVEASGSVSCRNPYIHDSDFGLCLGTGQTLYERCYKNKNYAECVRVLIQILKSKHGSGYRKWSDCGL